MNININPNSELHQSIVNVPDMVQVPEMWVDQARQFQQAMMRLDYRRFAAAQTNDFLNEQCLLIRKYAKNQWITTNYIPNYNEGHIGGSPALDFQSYTRYMVYGDNEGIGRRGYRVGNPLRIAWANDFFRPSFLCGSRG